jgi:23S rRNA (cytosine1962-C5)-methyltransferase
VNALLTVELDPALATKLNAGHPWVYRDHLPKRFAAVTGDWVRLKAGRFVGYALYDADSPIALRVFSTRGIPDAVWIRERVKTAFELRTPLRARGVDAYRWINGESDGLPALVVDVYGAFAVIVSYSAAVERLIVPLSAALAEIGKLIGVARRRSEGELEAVSGRLPPDDLVVREDDVLMHADVRHGQKTGLFLDQRDNRRYIATLAAGRRVLNLFSYTGSFALYSAHGGAAAIVNVDGSEPAMQAARDNFALNALPTEHVEFVVSDVFEYLAQYLARVTQPDFDLVIVDPPSFARSRAQLDRAVSGYTRLFSQALLAAVPGALYAASSCTTQVTPELFRTILADAAHKAKRRFQMFHEAGQAIDHPIMAGHPEGRYLKFVVGRVLPIV